MQTLEVAGGIQVRRANSSALLLSTPHGISPFLPANTAPLAATLQRAKRPCGVRPRRVHVCVARSSRRCAPATCWAPPCSWSRWRAPACSTRETTRACPTATCPPPTSRQSRRTSVSPRTAAHPPSPPPAPGDLGSVCAHARCGWGDGRGACAWERAAEEVVRLDVKDGGCVCARLRARSGCGEHVRRVAAPAARPAGGALPAARDGHAAGGRQGAAARGGAGPRAGEAPGRGGGKGAREPHASHRLRLSRVWFVSVRCLPHVFLRPAQLHLTPCAVLSARKRSRFLVPCCCSSKA